MSSRSKQLVLMAQQKTGLDPSSKEQQLLPIYTEDDIQMGILKPLSCCSLPDLPARETHKEIEPMENNTDGCFLKVSSNFNGFYIQPSKENDSVELGYTNDVDPSEGLNVTDILNGGGVSNENGLLINIVSSDVPIDTATNDYNIELFTTEQRIADPQQETKRLQQQGLDCYDSILETELANEILQELGQATLDPTVKTIRIRPIGEVTELEKSKNESPNLDTDQGDENYTKKGKIRKRRRFDLSLDQRKESKCLEMKGKHKVQMPCDASKCQKKCFEKIDQDRRIAINKMYWDLNWMGKKTYILNSINRAPVKRRRSDSSTKQNSFKYFLKDSDGQTQHVCKIFFLTTLGYKKNNDWAIQSFVQQDIFKKREIAPQADKRGRHASKFKISTEAIEQHIETFNPAVSHYRREHAPNRRYLPSDLSIDAMYRNFLENHPDKKCSYEVYRKVVKSKNISFTKLGHEECELCEGFQLHDASHDSTKLDENCEICQKWKKHINRANKSRELYKKECDVVSEPNTVRVSADLEKVIMLPRIDMFKRVVFAQRIVVYNESFVPLGTLRKNKPFAALWHEAITGRSKEAIISTFYSFLLYNRDVEHFVFWLDNCSSQNKNWAFFSFLIYIVNSNKVGAKDITINYFEPGHTFMSADSFHHQVELSLKKKKKVYDFHDFVEAVETCNLKRVIVKEMTVADFFDWKDYSSQPKLKKIEPRVYLSQVVKVIVERGSNILKVKTNDTEEFKEIDFLQVKVIKSGIKDPTVIENPSGIPNSKKENILKNLGEIIPRNRHHFWQELPTSDKQ